MTQQTNQTSTITNKQATIIPNKEIKYHPKINSKLSPSKQTNNKYSNKHVQYSTEQYSTVQYSTVQYSTVQYEDRTRPVGI